MRAKCVLPEQATAVEFVELAVVPAAAIGGNESDPAVLKPPAVDAVPAADKEEESEIASASAGPMNPPEAERRGCKGAAPTAVADVAEWAEPVVAVVMGMLDDPVTAARELSWADEEAERRERVEV